MKNIIFICTFLIVGHSAFAQVKVRPGLKLGLNSSDISNMNFSSSKTGINASTFVNIRLARFYELQPEIGYSQQGVERGIPSILNGFDPVITNIDQTLDLEYATIAIANKFYPVKNIGLNITLGPSIEILIGDDYDNDITPIDFALFGGIGYEFPFGLGIDVRYKQGFIDVRDGYIDIIDDTDNDYYDGPNLLNSVIQLGASYRFNF